MHPSRLFGLAAVLLSGVCAGTIDSSSGNATVTPAPRRNVRRERCFLVMNMACYLTLWEVTTTSTKSTEILCFLCLLWFLFLSTLLSPSSETARSSRCREQATRSDSRFAPHRE